MEKSKREFLFCCNMVGAKEIYNMLNQFEYYYGIEAEQFTFYRVPKILFKDQKFKKLSSDAKLLYGLMLDRMSLSIKNGWLFRNLQVVWTVQTGLSQMENGKTALMNQRQEILSFSIGKATVQQTTLVS